MSARGPASRRSRRWQKSALRRLVLGEAGPAPALVLAGVALVIAFIVTAGPLALTSAGNRATRQAIAQAPPFDAGARVTADYQYSPGVGPLSGPIMSNLARTFESELPMRSKFPPSQAWANVSVPSLTVLNAAPSAIISQLPILEVDFRSGLAGHSKLIAGSLPGRPGPSTPRASKSPGSVTLTVAVSKNVATTFSLRVGSVMNLGSAYPSGPVIKLRVTGIVAPLRSSSAFWQFEPVLQTPEMEGGSVTPFWAAAVFTGAGDLAEMAAAYTGKVERATWFFPMTSNLTTADVPSIEGQFAALASSPVTHSKELAAHAGFLGDTAITTDLADGLAIFTAQWRSTAGADSALVFGLFVAGLVLLLVCAAMAARAYERELILHRVRGGSLAQLAGRMLARSCCITLPALAIGIAVAMVTVPGGGGMGASAAAIIAALTAVLGTPLICVLAHRKPRLVSARPDQAPGRTSARRLTVEVMVLLVACAAIADLRFRGANVPAGSTGTGSSQALAGPALSGGTGIYLSASAVLVAVVVGLLVNRACPGPLRALARAASARKGPVGAVGLARAAAPGSSTWPALALMLSLTLAAFAVMVGASVSAGQVAASWAQVGGDALISVAGQASAVSAGRSPIPPGALSAIERVPGVRHVTTVYTASNVGAFAVSLRYGSLRSSSLGLAVVDPASYGALSADTPFAPFPASQMAEPKSGARGVVPIMVTPTVAATAAQHADQPLRLTFAGISVPAKIIGTVTATAAIPSGGVYVLMPSWAQSRLPSVPKPSTVLVTGSGIKVSALRATVRKAIPHSRLTVRGQVLHGLVATPVLHMSSSLYLIGMLAAVGLSVLAVLFALATSTRSRALMLTRLAALGMDRSQALLLVLTDAVPLVCVAAVGTIASSWLLAEVVGPVLGLNVFTGSSVPVIVRPTWLGLIVPLAGVALLALVFLAADGIAAGRRHVGAALRLEEAY